MNGYYNAVIELLKAHDYKLLPHRGKGAHDIWTNGKHNQTVSHNMPSRDMANTVLKQAGIKRKIP